MKRRELLETAIDGTALILLMGCSRSSGGNETPAVKEVPATCELPANTPQATTMMRATLEYVDRGTDPLRACDKCMQFQPVAGACGGCKLVPGPIHPKGTCKVFSALPA
jgi:hypothetical protein